MNELVSERNTIGIVYSGLRPIASEAQQDNGSTDKPDSVDAFIFIFL